MTTFTEYFDKLADLQKQGWEPARHITGAAVDVFEKVARKNYALCGDMVDFAVTQAKLPVDVAEPKELFERQMESTKAFTELLSTRASEYAELGKAFQEQATTLINKDFVEPAQEAASVATKAASAAAKKAG